MSQLHQDGKWRAIGGAVAALFAILFAGGVLLLWSWNTVAVDLFDAPAAQFKHALALELFIAAIVMTVGTALRLVRGRGGQSKKELA